jgi:D-ribose pyranase
MKKDRVLNPHICRAIAEIGHTEYLVIGDAGLPIPAGVKVIDVSVTRGVPGFIEVLEAIAEELVIESFIFASEAVEANPGLVSMMKAIIPDKPSKTVTHDEFKTIVKDAKTIIRTGECSSFANVILVCGVNF